MPDRSLPTARLIDPSPTRGARTLAIVIAIHMLILLNWRYGSLRFSQPIFNYIAVVAGLLCSWSVVFAIRRFPIPLAVKQLSTPLAFLWAAGCSLIAFFAALETFSLATSGVDTSFEPIGVHNFDQQRLVAYRTNGGATTSFGIVVRQELQIVPGLMFARRVYSVYPGMDVSISRLDERTFRFESPPYDTDRRSQSDIKIVRLGKVPW